MSISRRTALGTVGISGVQLLSPIGTSAITEQEDGPFSDAGPGPGSDAAATDLAQTTSKGGSSRRPVAKLLPRIPKAKLCCGLEVSQVRPPDCLHDSRVSHAHGSWLVASFLQP